MLVCYILFNSNNLPFPFYNNKKKKNQRVLFIFLIPLSEKVHIAIFQGHWFAKMHVKNTLLLLFINLFYKNKKS